MARYVWVMNRRIVQSNPLIGLKISTFVNLKVESPNNKLTGWIQVRLVGHSAMSQVALSSGQVRSVCGLASMDLIQTQHIH